jgi:hypothetical protein
MSPPEAGTAWPTTTEVDRGAQNVGRPGRTSAEPRGLGVVWPQPLPPAAPLIGASGRFLSCISQELATADPAPLFSVEYTAPNWSLREASENRGLADAIDEISWNVVVLQDVSWYLSTSVDERRARTMLFMTWGYKGGAFRGDTYEAMQARLAEGYRDLAAELAAEVASVGLAWAEALRRKPGLELWNRDGAHPSRSGSYLAACVFYAVLTGRDPRGSDFTAGFDPAEARFLQDVASDVAARVPAPA